MSRLLEFDDCHGCPFHIAIWTQLHDLPSEEIFREGNPVCVCGNGQVNRPGLYRTGNDAPVLCRANHGNARRTFKGKFPAWCPLQQGVNHVDQGGFFGELTICPPKEWYKGPIPSDPRGGKIVHQAMLEVER